ncbi:uncharacterized protein LOC114358366 [Ostrinia furnacalis]|uniref:uncharacterized protein LOC114358366 n=1 Tax=Ostrinia furnacalis TaxID=93504 RepID=UPI00103AE886|nr:uncharacterized protein LOC114358366 [Ostrinia furnacalis]
MPLKRTPPVSPAPCASGAPNNRAAAAHPQPASSTVKFQQSELQHQSRRGASEGSDSSPSSPHPNETEKFISHCNKRQLEGDDHSDMRAFMAEMRMYFTNFSINQDKKLTVLQDTITAIRDQNAEIFKTLDFMSQKYDDLNSKINKLEDERKNNQQHIAVLEDRIDFLEKKGRATFLEIRNIPINKVETKDCLCDIVGKLGSLFKIPIETTDIRDVYRIGSKARENKPIIVELSNVMKKTQLITAFKKFNRVDGAEKLNTQHLHIEGKPQQIYIGESLTPKLKRLFHSSREFAKLNNYNYCWTANGSIYIRKREGDPHIRINADSDFDKLHEQS